MTIPAHGGCSGHFSQERREGPYARNQRVAEYFTTEYTLQNELACIFVMLGRRSRDQVGVFVTRDKSNVSVEIGTAYTARRQNLRSIAARAGEHEAEDAIQDAFVSVIEEAQQREVRALDKLVSRVVRFAAINRFRRSKTRLDYARANNVEGAVNTAADPERALMGAQRLKRVLATIESMPSRRREVFLMHRVDEMTYPQIARRVGISVKAVEKHMHLAMRQLSDADE